MLTNTLQCQAGKVYVQDRLRETGQHVWDLMQRGAHFYVCGDAAHMATAVEQALLDVISQYQVAISRPWLKGTTELGNKALGPLSNIMISQNL